MKPGTPQAIDMILFPLAILFFLEGRKAAYAVTIAVMVYSHGVWAYLNFAALALYSIIYRKNIIHNIYAFLATLPIFALTIWYLPGYLGSHGGLHSRQEELALSSATYLAGYMGWIVVILMAIAVTYLVYHGIRYRKIPYTFSKLEKVAVLWLITLLPIFLFLRDRFASYAVPPIAILLSGWIVRSTRQRKYFIPALFLLTIIAMMFILVSWVSYFPAKDQLFTW